MMLYGRILQHSFMATCMPGTYLHRQQVLLPALLLVTAHIGDPANDFAGHLTIFGENSLRDLITAYTKQGGRIWDKLYEHTIERAAASALAYGYFALETNDKNHIQGARAQLGVI